MAGLGLLVRFVIFKMQCLLIDLLYMVICFEKQLFERQALILFSQMQENCSELEEKRGRTGNGSNKHILYFERGEEMRGINNFSQPWWEFGGGACKTVNFWGGVGEGRQKINKGQNIEITCQLQYLMNFTYNLPLNFATPEEVALYFNSLCYHYDYPPTFTQNINLFPESLGLPYFPGFSHAGKQEDQQERPTDDMEHFNTPQEVAPRIEIKMQQNLEQDAMHNSLGAQAADPEADAACVGRNSNLKEKNLKKNTQSNIINNVFSYICSEHKSHRAVEQLIGNDPDKIKIFYIFANNFKRINGKYLNRKNIKAICEIVPRQPHFKMLSKSIKRLLVLPMKELRVILRKLIFGYLRGPESILPLLTSKKIDKIATHEHINRTRDLCKYLESMLKDYN